MKIFIPLIALLTFNMALAKQKFYKWTDENGVTHYTAEKPENNQTDEISVSTNQPVVIQKPTTMPQTASHEDPLNEDTEDEPEEKTYLEQRREKKKQAKETASENKSRCQKAKQKITKFQQKVRMSSTDSKTGEKVYLEDSKRAEIIKKAQSDVKKFCR